MTHQHQSQSEFATEKGSQYLQTICKHFGHKLPTEYTPQIGTIEFPFGDCGLTADSSALRLMAKAGSVENLERLKTVLSNHLARFAFREKPVLEWS